MIWINQAVGNFGIAILLLTVVIKLIFFPLANKSYRSMSKLKKLQPEMVKLRERFGEDKMRLNQEMMALYKKEGANPASGCLPMVIQIPVFFALYKVLFVTIEMRQAPFYGWIQDLSQPDPTSMFNLFGLIPWSPPDFMLIGIWPLIMGGSMFLQQKLNPQPADPIQAKVFLLMPVRLHVSAGPVPGGSGDLLGLEQRPVHTSAMGDHETHGRVGLIDPETERQGGGPVEKDPEEDSNAVEHGRWLFAQDCRFLLGAAQLDQIPETSLPEVAFAGRSKRRQVQPGQCLDRPPHPGPHFPRAGPHTAA